MIYVILGLIVGVVFYYVIKIRTERDIYTNPDKINKKNQDDTIREESYKEFNHITFLYTTETANMDLEIINRMEDPIEEVIDEPIIKDDEV